MVAVPVYLLKFQWGRRRLDELTAGSADWLAGGHHRSWLEPARAGTRDFIFKASADPVPVDPFALQIGDVLHSLRSGLDHLAYQLAAKFTNPLPPAAAEASQFPIVGDVNRKGVSGTGATRFHSQSASVSAIHPHALRAIETMQPYHRGSAFASHPLWRLAELSNIDKHRILHLVVASSGGLRLTIGKMVAMPFAPGTVRVFAGVVTTDTVIARFPLLPEEEYGRDLVFDPGLFLAFEQTPTTGVLKVLEEIYQHIQTDVLPPLQRFL